MVERRRSSRRDRRRAGAGAWGALRITPMIDVVFLLLLYFALNARFAPRELVFRVDTPRVQRAGAAPDPFALPERPITISVRSHAAGADSYALRTDSTLLPPVGSYAELTSALASARGASLGYAQRFIVRPERGALWEHSLGAFDAVVKSGFTSVRFAEPAS